MKYWLLIIIGIILASCQNDATATKVDTSTIDIDYNLVRYDERILDIDSTRIPQELNALNLAYPEFTSLYFTHILPLKGRDTEEIAQNLNGFLKAGTIKDIKSKIDSIYGDFDKTVKPDIDEALKLYKHYFPNEKTPDIYTFISEFGFQTILFENGLGIGLDLFLGENYPYKNFDPKNPTYSDYLTRAFNKEHISKKMMEGIIAEKLGNPQKNQMLDYMLNHGKKLYILDRVLQNKPDSVILEMPQKQVDWLKANEQQIYSFFLTEDLFYNDNMLKINKYINPSPNSPGMPAEAPGRTANFIGWKIIESYMKKHPELTMQELINEKNAQKIMQESRYKPAK